MNHTSRYSRRSRTGAELSWDVFVRRRVLRLAMAGLTAVLRHSPAR